MREQIAGRFRTVPKAQHSGVDDEHDPGLWLPEYPPRDYVRASVEPGPETSVPYEAAPIGTMRVQSFLSVDDEDRGGVVLRITVEGGECTFSPTAVKVPGGVEIHMAGDVEGECLMLALKGLVEKWKWRPELTEGPPDSE